MTTTNLTRPDDDHRQLLQYTPSRTAPADLDESAVVQLRRFFELLDRWDRENDAEASLEKDPDTEKH